MIIVIYNLYLHPLANFPGITYIQASKLQENRIPADIYVGPASRAAFHFWDCWYMLRGNAHHDTQDLHDRFGPFVRIMSNALSFNTTQAWKGTPPKSLDLHNA